MKIQLCSDLHLEFEDTFRAKNAGGDTLILSGDICMASYFKKGEESPYFAVAREFRDFFRQCSDDFDNVIYVMGNHEHYRGYVDTTAQIIQNELEVYRNVHFLDAEHVDIDGVRFIGATLWTDLNRANPVTEQYLRGAMNDFRLVQWSHDYRKFTPLDAYHLHRYHLKMIDELSSGHDRVVVCSHHAPSYNSIHPMYRNDTHMNGGYHSQLDDFILDRPQIKLWTHGHVHNTFDYTIGDTRVWCNPRGYNDENVNFDMEKVIEV